MSSEITFVLAAEKIIEPSSSRISRFESDIAKWCLVLNSAESVENPTYADLIRTHREIDLDSEITSVKTIRKNYVHSREHLILKNGKEDEQATEFFKGKFLYDLIDMILDSSYWGFSLIQLENIIDDKLTGLKLSIL